MTCVIARPTVVSLAAVLCYSSIHRQNYNHNNNNDNNNNNHTSCPRKFFSTTTLKAVRKLPSYFASTFSDELFRTRCKTTPNLNLNICEFAQSLHKNCVTFNTNVKCQSSGAGSTGWQHWYSMDIYAESERITSHGKTSRWEVIDSRLNQNGVQYGAYYVPSFPP